jgi:hypothetical protein
MGAFLKIIDLKKDSETFGEIMASASLEALKDFLEANKPVEEPEDLNGLIAQDAVITED